MTTAKSERYRVREMELEFERDMAREKMLAELLKNPRVFYAVAILGSAGVAFLGALLWTPKDDEEREKRDAVLKQNPFVDLFAGSAIRTMDFAQDASANPFSVLLATAGAGGVAYWSVCLILHEIFGGENSTMGEQMLTAFVGKLPGGG